MGIAAFPPIGVETWTEVATASPTSGSSVTFSSLAATSKLRIVGFAVKSTSTSGAALLTINNDTSLSYAYGYDVTGSPANNDVQLPFDANGVSFDFTFVAANQPVYKQGSGYSAGASDQRNNYNVTWANTSVINRFDVTLSAGTFTAGTIKVFAA
jgi:hypothetical protein